MDLQFLQTIPDGRAAEVLTPVTDSSPSYQSPEFAAAYQYGKDLFLDYQQYLICYHLQEIRSCMLNEEMSSDIVDEYLRALNQWDSTFPTSHRELFQDDNNTVAEGPAWTPPPEIPPNYSRDSGVEEVTWSPFPINTKDEFEALEKILANDEEKREGFVSIH